ncbi:hypothetical protein ACHQM5_026748 [Ranunculus cassubicifolius]
MAYINPCMAVSFNILKTRDVVSFTMFFAPVPTFVGIYRKKSSEGFQAAPYVVSLLSAMFWVYYALLDLHGKMLILVINCIGCAVQIGYLITYLTFAPRKGKINTLVGLGIVNVLIYGAIVGLTLGLSDGSTRNTIVGWISSAAALSTFAAPLGIMNQVIKTKSAEYLLKYLSFFQTLCSVIWFCYGLLIHDMFVALPNVLGFLFAVTQVGLYIKYKDGKGKSNGEPETELSEIVIEASNGDSKTDLEMKLPAEIVIGVVPGIKLPILVIDVAKDDQKTQPSTAVKNLQAETMELNEMKTIIA